MTETNTIINFGDILNGFIYTLSAGIILALINFLITKIYNKRTGSRINFIWREKQSPLEKLIKPKSEKQIKKRIKILLIDDEKSLNIEQFNDEGYSIEYWPKVRSIKELHQGIYDIIILDIKNVAKEFSKEDGFGVLKSIKQNNPSQIVIAFSAHSYDFSKKVFWDMADEAVDKPSGFLEMKEVLDIIIRDNFSAKHEAKKLKEKVISFNLSKNQLFRIEKRIAFRISSKKQLQLDTELNVIHNSIQRYQIKNMLLRFINLYTDYETE